MRLLLSIAYITCIFGCASNPQTSADSGGDTSASEDPSQASDDFVPADVPKLQTTSSATNQPFYFYLFTHTEDHINHDLSEERYLRAVPELAKLAAENPEAHLVWTIEFMGADAKTVYDRNPQTGVVDLLKKYAAEGILEFGYHAHHDPTYNNRPQNSFTENTSWVDMVNGMDQWISCEKDPVYGGCVKEAGGGALAIQNNIGDVQIITGFFTFTGGANEHDVGSHVIKKYFPNRRLGFGFPNHGAMIKNKNYRDGLAELLTVLSPTFDTSGAVIGMKSLNLREGIDFAKGELAKLDRSRPNFVQAGFVSKYVYTVDNLNTSPTKWAYAHPDSPQLPAEQINSQAKIESNYDTIFGALGYLVEDVIAKNPGSRFLSNANVVEIFGPDEYWKVSAETLDVLSRWSILKWTDRPPNYVSDGTEFYSLRDLFVLLVKALGGD